MNKIHDYIAFEGGYFKKYGNHGQLCLDRYFTFKAAISLFLQRKSRNIVETGCQRQMIDWGAGNSSLIFSETLVEFPEKGFLYTIDIDENKLDVCNHATKHTNKVKFCLGDSVEILKIIDVEIGLLYLDSMDYEVYQQKESQLHQLKEIQTAYPKLNDESIVLLDDNFFENGGKPKLAKEFLKEMGWVCVLDHHQTLWIKH